MQAWEKYINPILWLCYGLFFLILALTAESLFRNLHFTSDGFHYYSAIRNFLTLGESWEGPTFEYLLGRHSYLTLFFMSPLIWIAGTPMVLAIINVFTHFLTGYLVYRCGCQVIQHPSKKLLSTAMGWLYILNPLVVKSYFATVYMFQPDYLLAPLLLLLFLSVLNRQIYLTLLWSTLIIFTKEEYIPLFPFFALCFFHLRYLSDAVPLSRKEVVKIAIGFLIASAISVGILYFFGNLNQNNQTILTSKYEFEVFARTKSWTNILKESFNIFSLWLVFFIAFYRHVSRQIFFTVLFYSFSFVIGRVALNQLVYQVAEGSPWGNALITPMLFSCIVVLIGAASLQTSPRILLRQNVFVIVFSLSLYSINIYKTQTIVRLLDFLQNKIAARFDLNDVEEIKAKLESPKGKGYIITHEYLMAPFSNRSHVSVDWLYIHNLEFQEKLLKLSDYIILLNGESLTKRLANDSMDFAIVAQTKTFSCFRPIKK